MKRLLLPLLAALALPNAAMAKNAWMILVYTDPPAWNEAKSAAIEKFEMSSMEICLKAANKLVNLKLGAGGREKFRAVCMEDENVEYIQRESASQETNIPSPMDMD